MFTSLSILPPNSQHPPANDLMKDRSWAEQYRPIAFHTVYVVINVVIFCLAQAAPASAFRLIDIIDQCSQSLSVNRILSSLTAVYEGSIYDFIFPPCSLIIWLVLCKTQLGARLGATWESMSKVIDNPSSVSHESRGSSAVTANRLRIQDPFLAYGNSVRILYRNDKILVQVILTLGAHIIRWKFRYLYCYCSMVAVPILHAILHSIIRHCMPQSYNRIVMQANDLEQRLEIVAANLQLIEIPRLISSTILIWPMRDLIRMFIFVRDLRDNLHHKLSQDTDTQNKWSVGQVAAIIAWLPLCTQILELGFNLWESQSRNLLP